MKRFAVLFGILALVCANSFAEAPSLGDLPELRLVPNTGAVTPLLQPQLMDEYNVFDFVKDANDDPADMTVSINSVDAIAAPEQVSALAIEEPTIEVDAAGNVDVYGFASPAWFAYVVEVQDASTIETGTHVTDTAVAKYSTFALDGPSIDSGRLFGDLTGDDPVFTYVFSEGELVTPALAGNLTPDATADVTWSIFVNEAAEQYNLNGGLLGLEKAEIGYAAEGGSSGAVDGIVYTVGTDGSLTLTASGTIGAGPWIVGILATDDADDANADGARIMVASGMLGLATGSYTPSFDSSETLEGLTLGTIPAAGDAVLLADGSATFPDGEPGPLDFIGAQSHWQYKMTGSDSLINSIDLEVVALASDTDLPAAAAPIVGVATGNAIKATFGIPNNPIGPVSTGAYNRIDGFRLMSGLFGGINYGDVYTFTYNIASDAVRVQDVPRFQIFGASAIPGTIAGANYQVIPGAPDLIGATPQLAIPTADQGWFTIGTNYSPGAESVYFDINLDGVSDQADKDLLFEFVLSKRGATTGEEKDYMQVGTVLWGSDFAESAVTIWIDNFRVFKSMYQLDLALGPQELDTLTSGANMDILAGPGIIPQTSGWDGSIDSYVDINDDDVVDAAELDAIGFFYKYDNGAINGYGPMFMPTWQQIRAATDVLTISAHDHTLNGAGAGQSLALSLAELNGQDGPVANYDAMFAELFTAVVDANGTGLYAMECYASTNGPYNGAGQPRHPEIRIILNEVMPNVAGSASGYLFTNTGLPMSVSGETPTNWRRVVTQLFINDAAAVHGIIQMFDNAYDPVDPFDLTIYLDDFKFYKVDDDVDYFDEELFDGV